jgi:DNA mismatch endonuclease (patch repair protein)
MVDVVDIQTRSRMMSGIRGRNTKPELIVRSLLFAGGYRFRLHRKDLPGKPDIVLPKYGTVINVHGCFWHGHEGCRLYRLPKSRTEFWQQKISSNIARDERNSQLLEVQGWRNLVVWECSLKGPGRLDAAHLLAKIVDFLGNDKRSGEILADT